ncbi:helix-turn-helix domain-containing protein, partial [Paractinoplanes atraurantiacus]|uniref:helix-turn-helix domain-containing protein n=1 Tax=Paractinoplanes atraurantiacus TaxID=1036182 RepID=UPI0011788B8B
MGQGWSNGQACREVGISPATGRRWRHGYTIHAGGRVYTYPPLTATPGPVAA